MNTNAPALTIDGIIIPVAPHPEHEYTLTTAEVAAGYGVSEITLRRHKKEHSYELAEGKHFISVQNLNSNPRAGIPHVSTAWTKRGIIRLGFFIRSERARRFRDMAEDLCLREWERPAPAIDHSALVAAVRELTAEVRELRHHLARPPVATGGDTIPSLPSSTPDPLADWIARLALDMRGTRETARRYTVPQLHALQPPGGPGPLGRRLANLVGHPVPAGYGGHTATCRPVRTARARYWEIRLHPPLWASVLRHAH